jgi:hypothetical protein
MPFSADRYDDEKFTSEDGFIKASSTEFISMYICAICNTIVNQTS